MRTLVTGATGFVGRYLVRELLERGHQVTALVRPSRSLPPGWAARGVVRLGVDLRHPSEALGKSIAGADAVFHLAATTAGSWRAMFDATVLSTENLIEAMRAAGWRGRLVHVSHGAMRTGRTVTSTRRL